MATKEQKLIESLAIKAEDIASQASELAASFRAWDNHVLSKKDFEDWKLSALTIAVNAKLLAAWLNNDVDQINKEFVDQINKEFVDQIVTQQIKDKTNG